jgi:hypothetical protein
VIQFQYELEFPFGTDPATDIIPTVKKTLTESVRSVLSANECSNTRNLRRTHEKALLQISRRRRLEVTGMDPSPVMRILDGTECQAANMVDESNDCVVVEGHFVVYTDGTGEVDTTVVEDALKAGLENTEVLSTHARVDRVTFIGDAKTQGTASQASTAQKHLGQNSTWLTVIAIFAVAWGL